MKKEIIFENDIIEIATTGHDYDFIAYIENKTDKPIKMNIAVEDNYYEEDDAFIIEANNWIGLLADDEGYNDLDQIKKRNFKIL